MASNFFDKASLVMVPDAPFDGTLPSVKPFDRSGDFTFSRGSNLAATRVDPDGNIEKGRENLILQSNQFDTTWLQYQGGTVTSGQSDKDGGKKAWKLNVVDNQSFSGLYQSISGSGVCTMSIFAKAGTLDRLGIVNMSGSGFAAWFDLSSGTIGTQNSSNIDAKIEAVGSDGWYRVSITQTLTSGDYFQLKPSDGETTPSGEDGYIYIMNAQAEYGLVATDYLETKTTTKKAGVLEDEPRIDFTDSDNPALLLEPQRTNLVTNSEYFGGNTLSNATIETNSTTSPEGVKNASTLEANGNGVSYIQFTTSAPTGDKVVSVFAKEDDNSFIQILNTADGNLFANFDLSDGSVGTIGSGTTASIEDYGNGWYRCICVWDSAETINAYDRIYMVDTDSRGYGHSHTFSSGTGVFLWGAQIGNNVSYPTSYIPTYGASVTRSSEYGTASNPDDFTTNSCTMLLEVDLPQGREGAAGFASLIAGSTSVGWKGNYTPSPIVQLNGNGTISDSSTFSLSTGVHKLLFKWHNGTAEIFIDGVKKSSTITDSAAPTSFTSTKVDGGGYRIFQKQLVIFPTALTDSECIALTTI